MLWPHREAARDDRGETLVEVLAAVVILGIAGVAVMAGLTMSVKASDIHRKDTTSGAYVRSFAEAIEDYVATPGTTNYKPCALPNAYKVPAVTDRLADLPGTYVVTQAAAKSVGPTGLPSTCTADTGVQQLTLTVGAPDGKGQESLTIVVRKPCDPSVSACLD